MATPEPGSMFRFGVPVEGTPQLSAEIRECLEALARLHLTTDEDVPAAPRDGMPRLNAADPTNVKLQVYFDGDWRTIVQGIQFGVPAPAKVTVQFNAPGTNPWQIDHNLGTAPLVQVFDVTWKMIPVVYGVPGANQCNIQHTNGGNRVVVTFSGNTAGYAILIG